MALLIGENEQTIDPAKHRLAINAMFRDQIDAEEDGTNFVLILGPDRHLWLYPDRYYARLVATMKRSPLPTIQQRDMSLFFAMARMVRPDAQGRIVLPEKSMQRAILAEQVTVVGNCDHLEIWPTHEWEPRVVKGLETYGQMLYEASDRLAQAERDKTP